MDVSQVVYEELDLAFSVDGTGYVVSTSLSGQYVFIRSAHAEVEHETTEIRFRASNKPSAEFLIVEQREEGRFYDVKHQGEYFYILASTRNEPNGEVFRLKIPPAYSYEGDGDVQVARTKEVSTKFLGAEVFTPARPNVYIQHLETLRKHTIHLLKDTTTSLQYLDIANLTHTSHELLTYDQFHGELQVANNKSYRIEMLPQSYDSDTVSYKLSTLHSPDKLVSMNLTSKKHAVLRLDRYYPHIRLEDYTSERIVLSANDGERIPVTLVYHRDKVDKKATVLLHTYGSAAVPSTHQFSTE